MRVDAEGGSTRVKASHSVIAAVTCNAIHVSHAPVSTPGGARIVFYDPWPIPGRRLQQAVPDFLSNTDARREYWAWLRKTPKARRRSANSGCKKRRETEEGRRPRNRARRVRNGRCFSTPSFTACEARCRKSEGGFLLSYPVISLLRAHFLGTHQDGGQAR